MYRRDYIELVEENDIALVIDAFLAAEITMEDVFNLYVDLTYEDINNTSWSKGEVMKNDFVEMLGGCLTIDPLFPEDFVELKAIWDLRRTDLDKAIEVFHKFWLRLDSEDRRVRGELRTKNKYPDSEMRLM